MTEDSNSFRRKLITCFLLVVLLASLLNITPYSNAPLKSSHYVAGSNIASHIINNMTYASPSYSATFENNYPNGICGASQWEISNDTNSKFTAPTSVNIVPNGFVYPVVGSGSSSSQCSASPLTYGLVGYWPLQEGTGSFVYDVAGNNNTGSLNCRGSLCTKPTWQASCLFGSSCLRFDGSQNSTVRISSTHSLEPSSITLSAWVKFSSLPANGTTGWIIGKTAGSNGYGLYVSSNGLLAFQIWNDLDGTIYSNVAFSSRTINTGEWFLASGTFDDASSTLHVFINSSFTGTATDAYGIGYDATNVNIGADGGDPLTSPNAAISDARIYNVPLDSSEVFELYHSVIPMLEHQVNSSGNTYYANFYKQYLTNITQNGNPNTSTFNYSNMGSPQTVTLTTSFESIWADTTRYSFSDSYSSTNDRYSASNNGTIVSPSNLNATYYHQFYITNGKNLTLTTIEYGQRQNVTLSNTWADSNSNLLSTGIMTFTFHVNYGGVIYQEPSRGFQIFSNITVSEINYSVTSNQLSFKTSGKSNVEVGIYNGSVNYLVFDNGLSLKYSRIASIIFFNGNSTSNNFVIAFTKSNSNTSTTVESNSSSQETGTHDSLFTISVYIFVVTLIAVFGFFSLILSHKRDSDIIKEYILKYWTIPFIVALIVMFTVTVTLLSQGNTSGSAKAAIYTFAVLLIGMILQIELYFKHEGDIRRKTSIGSQYVIRYVRENWGAPFVFTFIVLLLTSAAILSKGNTATANSVTVYAFYSLTLGVVLQIASHMKYGSKED